MNCKRLICSGLVLLFTLLIPNRSEARIIDPDSLAFAIEQQDPQLLEGSNWQQIDTYLENLRRSNRLDSLRSQADYLYQLATLREAGTVSRWALYYRARAEHRLDLAAFDSTTTKLLREAQTADHVEMIGLAHKLRSDLYSQTGNIDRAIESLEKAIATLKRHRGFSESPDLKLKVGQFRHNLTNQYYKKQMHEKALDLALANKQYAVEIGDKELETRTYQVLSAIYSAIGSYADETESEIDIEWYYDRSRYFAKQYVDAAKELGNVYLIGFAYATLANMFTIDHQYDSAVVYFERSLGYALETNDRATYASRLGNVAANLVSLGKYRKADQKLEQALNVAREINYPLLQSRLANNLAYNALQMGKLDRARTFAMEAITLGLEMERYSTVSQAYGNLAGIEEESGDMAAALQAYKSHIQFRDSVFNQENLARMEELQTRYETEQKEAEIKFLSQENELQAIKIQQRNIQIIGVVLILLLLAVGGYLWYLNRLNRERRITSEANQQLLSVQMNPHFLFNALSAIQNFIIQDRDRAEVVGYVSKFGKVIRSVLNYSREKFITLEEEIDLVTEFLALQQKRISGSFTYRVTLDPAIDPTTVLIPPMLTQPYIENAVEHGILQLKEKQEGVIEITISKLDQILNIDLVDNGVGIEASRHQSENGHKSLALEITRERFSLLEKITGKTFSVRVEDRSQGEQARGTRVSFEIPVLSS